MYHVMAYWTSDDPNSDIFWLAKNNRTVEPYFERLLANLLTLPTD